MMPESTIATPTPSPKRTRLDASRYGPPAMGSCAIRTLELHGPGAPEPRGEVPLSVHGLLGASRDACFSRRHKTTRFAQKDRHWLEVLGFALDRLGHKSWTYSEGKRGVYVLETSWRDPEYVARSAEDAPAFVRGYFDAEGGIPRSPTARFYIQLVQKDKGDLAKLHRFCTGIGLACGRLHNPSASVDPEYWRFYVLSRSHRDFVAWIGSWHPSKRERLMDRFPEFSLPR